MKMNDIISAVKVMREKKSEEPKSFGVEDSKFSQILAEKSEKKELFLEKNANFSSQEKPASEEESVESSQELSFEMEESSVEVAVPFFSMPAVALEKGYLKKEEGIREITTMKTSNREEAVLHSAETLNTEFLEETIPVLSEGEKEELSFRNTLERQIEEARVFKEVKIVKADGEVQTASIKKPLFSAEKEEGLLHETQEKEMVPSGEMHDLFSPNGRVSLKVADAPIHINQREYPETLATKIHFEFSEGKSVFRMNLSPEHLGKIDVELSVEGDEAVIKIVTETEEAYRIFTSDRQVLRNTLQTYMDSKAEVVISLKEGSVYEMNETPSSSTEYYRDSEQGESRNPSQRQREKEEKGSDRDFSSDFKIQLEG